MAPRPKGEVPSPVLFALTAIRVAKRASRGGFVEYAAEGFVQRKGVERGARIAALIKTVEGLAQTAAPSDRALEGQMELSGAHTCDVGTSPCAWRLH